MKYLLIIVLLVLSYSINAQDAIVQLGRPAQETVDVLKKMIKNNKKETVGYKSELSLYENSILFMDDDVAMLHYYDRADIIYKVKIAFTAVETAEAYCESIVSDKQFYKTNMKNVWYSIDGKQFIYRYSIKAFTIGYVDSGDLIVSE